MSETLGDFLLVRAGPLRLGFPLDQVVEVSELGSVHSVPSHAPALRGVTVSRGRVVPLVHLGALLGSEGIPDQQSGTAVLTALGGHAVCLEVDEADVITREELLPVPANEPIPWALAVVRRDDGLIPILNLGALAERLANREPDA